MIRALLKERTNNTVIQFVRYTFVGGIAFIFDIGLLFILTAFLNVYYLISAAVSFMVGLSVNYTFSIFWVFERRSLNSKPLEFILFACIGIIGLGLNEFFIWFFTEIVQQHYLLSKIASTGFVYIWNFLVRKYTLFR